jgi:hypothetical protein
LYLFVAGDAAFEMVNVYSKSDTGPRHFLSPVPSEQSIYLEAEDKSPDPESAKRKVSNKLLARTTFDANKNRRCWA